MGDAKQYIIPIAIGFATGGIGFSVTAGFTWTTSSAILGAIMAAASVMLAPKPEMPDFGGLGATSQDRAVSFKQPLTTRKLAYGLLKAGGPVVYVACTPDGGEKNKFLHLITAHAVGEIRTISKWFIDDTVIVPADLDTGLATGGNVNAGEYNGLVRILPRYGSVTQEAIQELMSEAPEDQWTSAHRLQGIFYIYWRFKYDKNVFKNLPSVAVEFYGSKGIYDPRTSAASTTIAQEANPALILRDYLTNSFGLGATSGFIDDTNFSTAANVCDEVVQYADGTSPTPTACTVTHVGDHGTHEGSNSYGFANIPMGTPSSTSVSRVICLLFNFTGKTSGAAGGTPVVTSMSIGGETCTLHQTSEGGIDAGSTGVAIGSLVNNTLTTAEINISLSVGAAGCMFTIFNIYESDGTVTYKGESSSSSDDHEGGLATTVQFPRGSAVIAGATKNNSSGGTSIYTGYQSDGSPETHSYRYPWTNSARTGFIQLDGDDQATLNDKTRWWGYGVNLTGSTVLQTTFGASMPRAGTCSFAAVGFNPAETASATHARYQAAGLVDTGTSMKKNIESILTSMCGSLIYSGGKFKVQPASPAGQAMTLAEDDFVGDIQINPQLSRRDNFNTVQGTYISPDNNYQPSNYPSVTSALFKSQDNDEELLRDFVLPFTTDGARAQRIARIALFTNRQPLTFNCTLSLVAFSLDIGDVVAVTLSRYGWTEKLFSMTSYAFTSSGNSLYIAATFKEYADATYDWTSTDQEVIDSAPNTVLPVFTSVEPVTDLVATEKLVTTRDARGVQSLLSVTFGASEDAFVSYYEMDYKKTTDSSYTSGGQSTVQLFEILDLEPATYDIRVRATNVFDTTSSYTSIQKITYGLLAAPSAMTNLSAQDVGGMCFLQWDLSNDLDVRVGGHVEIRFQNVSTGATWITSQLVDNTITGMSTSAIVPLRAGTYLCKFVDSSGNKQGAATAVVSDGATILDFTDDETVTESPSFAGTKTTCHVDDSYTPDNLVMNAGGTIDAFTDNIDTADNFDFIGGVATSATYEFANKMDHSSVKRIRITLNMSSTIFVPSGTKIDSRPALVDTWEDWDETGDATPANVIAYYAHTANDPATATDWSVWKRFTQREERARGVKFKLEFTNTDAAYNLRVSALSAVSAVI